MIFISGILLGLAASLHCMAMCGPLVMAVHYKQPSLIRNLVYHTGRLLSYVAIGLLFGLAGQTLAIATGQGMISAITGLTILLAILAGTFLKRVDSKLIIGYSWFKSLMIKDQGKNKMTLSFLLGTLNGLLPCGMVYMAAAAAVATGSAFNGSVLMLGFGLATWPALLITVFAGQRIKTRISFNRFSPWLYTILGVMLVVRGLWLGVPYVSPGIKWAVEQTITTCGL